MRHLLKRNCLKERGFVSMNKEEKITSQILKKMIARTFRTGYVAGANAVFESYKNAEKDDKDPFRVFTEGLDEKVDTLIKQLDLVDAVEDKERIVN